METLLLETLFPDTVFPEFFLVFPKINGKLVYSLLREYPTPSCYKGKHFDTIYAFACKEAKGHVNKEDIETKYGIVTYNPNKQNKKGNN